MLRKLTVSTLILALSIGSASAAHHKSTVNFDTDAKKASYGIGQNIGGSLKAQNVPGLDLDAVFVGLQDSMADKPSQISQEDLVAAFTAIQKQSEEEKALMANENLKKGEEFLNKNKDNDGVKVTDSGLQYRVITEGDGAKPSAEDVVVTNYRGKLIDGTEFDSSYERNEPVEFPVNRVIPGWTEALQMMPVGSKWELFVPAKLAYNEFSPTPSIPPNSTLVFEVELLDIKDQAKENTEAKSE